MIEDWMKTNGLHSLGYDELAVKRHKPKSSLITFQEQLRKDVNKC